MIEEESAGDENEPINLENEQAENAEEIASEGETQLSAGEGETQTRQEAEEGAGNLVSLKVNGEEKQYQLAELQKLAAAQQGFHELQREKQAMQEEAARWEAEKEETLKQERLAYQQEVKNALSEKIPGYLQQQLEREKQLEAMSDVERQMFLQNEEIEKLRNGYQQSKEEAQQIRQEMLQRQEAEKVQNAQQYFNTFFAQNGVKNPYIQTSFLNAVDELQGQVENINYQQLLNMVKEKYNETLRSDIGSFSEDEIANMLGEERLAGLQNYLVAQKNKKNPSAMPGGTGGAATSTSNSEDDGVTLAKAFL